jgi:hypothetical protein
MSIDTRESEQYSAKAVLTESERLNLANRLALAILKASTPTLKRVAKELGVKGDA